MSPGRGRDQVPLGSNPFAVADQACNFPLLGIFSDFLQKTLQIHACDSRVRIRLIQPLQHPRWVRLGQVRFRFCIIRHLCGQFFVLSVSVGLVFALARAAGKTSMAISRTGVRACAGSRIRHQSVISSGRNIPFRKFVLVSVFLLLLSSGYFPFLQKFAPYRWEIAQRQD